MRSFVALKTFECPELKSMYVEGLSYTIKPSNKYLNALAEVWALEKKIAFDHNPIIKAKVEGVGTVKYFSNTVDEDIWTKTKKAWRLLWP